jgi:hypothetical protein
MVDWDDWGWGDDLRGGPLLPGRDDPAGPKPPLWARREGVVLLIFGVVCLVIFVRSAVSWLFSVFPHFPVIPGFPHF